MAKEEGGGHSTLSIKLNGRSLNEKKITSSNHDNRIAHYMLNLKKKVPVYLLTLFKNIG